MALKQSGLYTHLSAQQAAAAVAAAAAEAAAARAATATNGHAAAAAGQARLPVNLSSLTPVPRSQLNLDVGREREEEIMAARVKEAAIMQVRNV